MPHDESTTSRQTTGWKEGQLNPLYFVVWSLISSGANQSGMAFGAFRNNTVFNLQAQVCFIDNISLIQMRADHNLSLSGAALTGNDPLPDGSQLPRFTGWKDRIRNAPSGILMISIERSISHWSILYPSPLFRRTLRSLTMDMRNFLPISPVDPKFPSGLEWKLNSLPRYSPFLFSPFIHLHSGWYVCLRNSPWRPWWICSSTVVNSVDYINNVDPIWTISTVTSLSLAFPLLRPYPITFIFV